MYRPFSVFLGFHSRSLSRQQNGQHANRITPFGRLFSTVPNSRYKENYKCTMAGSTLMF
jgi:hypothetical protein